MEPHDPVLSMEARFRLSVWWANTWRVDHDALCEAGACSPGGSGRPPTPGTRLIPLPNLPSLARLGPAEYETFQALSRMGMTAKDVLALIAANGGAVSTAGLVRADGTTPLTGAWNAGQNITAPGFVGALTGNASTASTAGTVTTAAQPTITSVGTLTGLIVQKAGGALNVFAFSPSSVGTGAMGGILANTGGTTYLALDNSTGGVFGAGNYATVFGPGDTNPLAFITSGTPRVIISAAGLTTINALTVTEAPTFSALTLGSVPFASTSGLIAQDNANLFWDATNARLGIGNTAPFNLFDVAGKWGARESAITLANGDNNDVAITSSFVEIYGPTDRKSTRLNSS